MKLYSTLLLLLVSLSCAFSQNTSTIILKSNKDIPEGYYLNIQNQNHDIEQGNIPFKSSFSIENPEYGFLIAPNGRTHIFWYEEGETEINFEQSLFKDKLIVNGSESHMIYGNLHNASDFKDFKSLFESHINSVVPLKYIDWYFKFIDFSEGEFREIHDIISKENRKLTPNFNAFVNTLDKDKLEKDAKLIDFIGYDKNGTAVNTDDFRGQYLLIDIAATWCGPCWGAFPYMIKNLGKYQNIQFITLNEDNDIERWKAIAEKRGLNIDWPVLWDVKSGKTELLLQYQIDSYPTYILVDPNGVVVERWDYSNEKVFNSKMKKYLN